MTLYNNYVFLYTIIRVHYDDGTARLTFYNKNNTPMYCTQYIIHKHSCIV